MNIKRLREVKRAIKDNPHELNMRDWFNYSNKKHGESECRTTACIAGWACYIYDKEYQKRILDNIHDEELLGKTMFMNAYRYVDKAVEFLELTHEQAMSLFYVHNWPVPFCDEYNAALSATERAKIVGQVIEYFIRRNGRM